MKVFNCYKNKIEYVGDNSLFKSYMFNDRVVCFSITNNFSDFNTESIVNSIQSLPLKLYDFVILDFSHFDFKLDINSFEQVNSLYSNLFFITNNWQLVQFENHLLFDPKLYKFETENDDFNTAVKFNRLLFKNHSKFRRPKKFINLTNHVRRERVYILDEIFKYKSEGYISFPNIDKFDDSIKDIDCSDGRWEKTEGLVKGSSFYSSLPILFDLFEKKEYDSNSVYNISNNGNLLNVGLLFNYGMYLTAYIEIFSETYYSESIGKNNFPIHSSEKTINPIWGHLPQTSLDIKDKMKYMKKMGFSFECPLNTPEYIDSMESSNEKTFSFINFCKDLIVMDIDQIHETYNSYFGEFQNNFEVMVEKMSKPYIIDKIQKYANL